MAYAKNKYSSKVHSKTRFLPHSKTPAQKIILIVIILAVILVLASIICTLIFNPERNVKSTISDIAAKYYEDYFYPNISSNNISKTMQKYTDTGFAKVTLRQLLLYNNQQNAKYQNLLTKYCDENATSVQFFPTEPFSSTDYRVEFTYSCSF